MDREVDPEITDFLDFLKRDNMNFITGTNHLNRKAPPNELCEEVWGLFRGSNMISQDGFQWVRGALGSKELDVLERFISYPLPTGEKEVQGYKNSSPPGVVKYTPREMGLYQSEPQPQPFLVCPDGYEDAVVVIRSLSEKTYLFLYEVSPDTTIQEIRDRKLTPDKYAITRGTLLIVPHKTKIALPVSNPMEIVYQVYSIGEPNITAALDKDVAPFMRRFYRR